MVRLELLDWGGSGPAVVLLTGSGHTTHVYDEFAPKLIDCCHVYGVTPRGYGTSSRPLSGTAPEWVSQAIGKQEVFRRDYSNIRVPVLSPVEFPKVPQEFRPKNEEERVLVEQFVARGNGMVGRWIDKLKRGASDVRIADMPGGGHSLFFTKEADVLREVRAFIAQVQMKRRRP